MTKREAVTEFRVIFPELFVKRNGKIVDRPMLDEAWNNWTDALCKDKQITQKQYDCWVHPF